jgi:hypothetical protein
MYFVDTWYIFSWLWYILWIFGIFFPGFGILYQENENENEMRKPHQKLFFLFFHDDPSALEGRKKWREKKFWPDENQLVEKSIDENLECQFLRCDQREFDRKFWEKVTKSNQR